LGRGLKESIIGLGEGKIFTKKNGEINGIKIRVDGRKALYDFIEDIGEEEDIKELRDSEKNGTIIKINVKNEKIKIPEGDKFKLQITNHYALRDINSSPKRDVLLKFEDLSGRKTRFSHSSLIKFIYPAGKLVIDKLAQVEGYKDQILIKIWESPCTLNFQRYDPCSTAGILIKTKGAVLDNQLFKYDNDSAAFYFRGEAYSEGIANRLIEAAKQGEESEIIDLARKGLNWRSDYCRAIQKTIEKQLAPLIEKKKKELETGEKKTVSHAAKKMLKDICKLLEKLAKKEFEEWEGPQLEEFEKLAIVPNYVNIEVGNARVLSVYAPKDLVNIAGTKFSVTSDTSEVKILFPGTKRLGLSWNINLDKHPKNPNMFYKFFKIIGYNAGKEAFIYCKLGNQQVTAIVKVVKALEKPLTGRKKKKRGGFISDIKTIIEPNPSQRVAYEEKSGVIKIYVKFPVIERYFSIDLKEIETREDSRTMLAELVGEAFCRALTRKHFDTGAIPMPNTPEAAVDAFNTEVNNMQNKYLDKIHEIILHWKLR